jgi:hypothetical protein
MLELTTAERALVESARDEFGGPLTRFILTGLGEEGESRRRSFIVTFINDDGAAQRRRLHVEADDLMPETPTCLPRRREPLVLLALLRLLTRGRGTTQASLSYDPGEALSLLGWDDNEGSRLAVEEAVERYFFLSYGWELGVDELRAKGLTLHRSRERIISAYSHGVAGEERVGCGVNVVDFGPAFIEELTGMSLFGVKWDAVHNVEVEAAN